MFTWICPQCGKEVPPAYNDCPDCSNKAAPAGGVPVSAPEANPSAPPPAYAPQQPPAQQPYYQQPPQPQQAYYPPPQQGQPAQPYYPQQPQQAPQQPPPGYYGQPAAPARGMNLPVWVMTILFALAIAGVVFGLIWMFSTNRGSAGNGPAPIASVESPAAKPGAKTNPLQKYIEISGVRFVEDPKKKTTLAKFVIVNHSTADINGLAGNVTIWARTQKSEEDAQGTFSFNTNLAPMESKEMSVPLNTKRKIYELGDWQNLTPDVQITAPAG